MMPEPIDPTGEVFVEPDDAATEVDTPETAPRGSVLRTATVLSGRIVLGIVAMAAIALVVGIAVLVPLPSFRSSVHSSLITPAPADQQLVCPGGLLRLGSASGESATTASAIGAARVTSAAVPGDVSVSAFAASDAGTGNGTAAPQLLSASAVPAGTTPSLVGGAQSERVSNDEFFGLAAAACTAASGEAWLSGGATTVGRTTLLLLANPTAVAATVSVQVFGENGAVTAPGMDGIAVAAGAQRVLSLAGFAPNLVSPVVHVQASGGQVVASLEQSTVRGLAPGGVDFVGTEGDPETTTVIPGVVLAGTAALQSELGQSGFEDLQTTLRVYLPGSKATAASITIVPENGSVTGKPITAQIQPGIVTDLPLDQLSDGSYTVLVTSRRPIIASVRASTASTGAAPSANSDTVGSTDFAWVTAAPLLTSSVLVPVATGMTPALHLDNPTGKPESVTLHAASGPDITATVPAHSAATVAVSPGAVYRMTGFTELYAAVSGVADGEVTSYVVSPSGHADGPLRIYG
jgi:Family of unknown function (DUF5719)